MQRARRTWALTLGLGVWLMGVPAVQAAEPPTVTAQGWVIGDGRTGEVLWGHEADVTRKSASTTKMMALYVVLQLAEKQPEVMDEIITFSELADKTAGSTAGVKAGERLTVAECLYGLMLPSGNDAGNALGEHFNSRLAPPDDGSEAPAILASRWNFIAEMNRTAKRLGMENTTYYSTFGDGGGPATRGTSSPADLLRLASAGMKHPKFRHYVGTRSHTTRVTGPGDASREVTWTNTNQLLGDEGYDGVKTGTSSTAGACLVASGRRGDDHLIVVILGSASSDDRYKDVRALFDWGWQQRAQ